jgi:chloride channel protein, CIC family
LGKADPADAARHFCVLQPGNDSDGINHRGSAGLAAAFNTPLSAITFVLEEIIEDLNNRAFLAQVLIASVAATFVSHAFLGDNPAFVIPSIGQFSNILYLLVIPTAGLAALVGVAFQKGTLIWRDKIKRIKHVPFFLKPAIGAGFVAFCSAATAGHQVAS